MNPNQREWKAERIIAKEVISDMSDKLISPIVLLITYHSSLITDYKRNPRIRVSRSRSTAPTTIHELCRRVFLRVTLRWIACAFKKFALKPNLLNRCGAARPRVGAPRCRRSDSYSHLRETCLAPHRGEPCSGLEHARPNPADTRKPARALPDRRCAGAAREVELKGRAKTRHARRENSSTAARPPGFKTLCTHANRLRRWTNCASRTRWLRPRTIHPERADGARHLL